MTIAPLINNFLKYLDFERQVSPKTLSNYDHYLHRFLDFAGDIDVSAIDPPLITRYRLHLTKWRDPLTDQPLKPVTQNYFCIALRAFLRFLEERGIPSLPAKQIGLKTTESRVPQVLDDQSVNLLLEAPDSTTKEGVRDRVILHMLFSTGMKVSEIASLNRVIIPGQVQNYSISGTGITGRTIAISDQAVAWLERYLASRKDTFKPLFIRYQGKVDPANEGEAMRLTVRTIQRIVEKYGKQIGLKEPVTPHVLRHSFATNLVMQGEDLKVIQEKLGHRNLSTTEVYKTVTEKGL